MLNNMRRVICAAIRAEQGGLIIGIRHYDAKMADQIFYRIDGHEFQHRNDEDQGFIDQFGIYMTRQEAWEVAEKAGQILYLLDGQEGTLYSENLY